MPANLSRDGAVPPCLAIGRCIEVWGEPGERSPYNAMRRFGVVRRWWLAEAGVTTAQQQEQLIPFGAPWSVEYLLYRGQAERAGRSSAAIVAERLAAAGCTVDDLDDLADEAHRLFTIASRADDPRKNRR